MAAATFVRSARQFPYHHFVCMGESAEPFGPFMPEECNDGETVTRSRKCAGLEQIESYTCEDSERKATQLLMLAAAGFCAY